MSERPILFSGPMVRAILEGRKTQTRRIVTDQTSQGNRRVAELSLDGAWVDGGPSPAGNPGPYLKAFVNVVAMAARLGGKWDDYDPNVVERLYPRIFPGDVLWVREMFYVDDVRYPDLEPAEALESIYYRADGDCCDQIPECQCADIGKPHWRPSIHMPRAACRLLLNVTAVRVERLREIKIDDLPAEGIDLEVGQAAEDFNEAEHAMIGGVPLGSYREPEIYAFAAMWDRLNAKRGSWESNPWVWVVEFEPLPTEFDEIHETGGEG